LVGVDAARCVALIGMMAIHVLPGVDPDGSRALSHTLAHGRAAAAFALVAGVSLGLATRRVWDGTRPWLAAAAAAFARALVIGAIGLALGSLDSGVAVILPYYAVFFVLMIPLIGLRARWLVLVAVLAGVVIPVLSHALRGGLPPPELTNPTFATVVDRPAGLALELLLTGYYPALPWLAYLATGLAVSRLSLRTPRTAWALLAGGVTLMVLARGCSRLLLNVFGGREARAAAEGIATGDLRQADWSVMSALVLAPGVPLTHPHPHWSVELARAAGVEIVGDIELFARERRTRAPDAAFVAITGTNGKSTTTALTAHVLAAAGRDTQMGGNIGRAVMTLDPPASGRHYVVECSSYQIDLAPTLDPSVGVLLNITPDHLDRHGTMENYAAIKERLVAGSGTAVVGVDDEPCRAIAGRLEKADRRVVRISVTAALKDGLYAEGRQLMRAEGGRAFPLASLDGIGSLRGRHNAQNALAAAAACLACGLSPAEIEAGFRSFPGLAHRMEEVGRLGRILFVNDSKATNADAAAPALSSFSRIYWIAGGLPKAGGIESLRAFFPRIAKAYLVGEAAPAFAATIGEATPYGISGTIDAAVGHAARDAAGDPAGEVVVLLSPACASFDQCRHCGVRGEAFRRAVLSLAGIEPIGDPKR